MADIDWDSLGGELSSPHLTLIHATPALPSAPPS